jgi:uncharacterized membrane-anchored protein
MAVPVLLLAQLCLVAVGVWPQLSARAVGEEIRLRVQPVDPIDPFRGAYVDLRYADLRVDRAHRDRDDAWGTVYITVAERDGVWVAEEWSSTRPDEGTFLRCSDRGWRPSCGIESWFLPQDEALALEQSVADGAVVATVRVDGRGNAALVAVDAVE